MFCSYIPHIPFLPSDMEDEDFPPIERDGDIAQELRA